MKIKLIKLIDKIFGDIFISFLPSKLDKLPDEINKILIIRPGGLGDAILLIPMIKKLQSSLPGIQINILAEKRNYKAFELINLPGDIYNYDNLEDYKYFFKYKYYDLVIDTEQWHRLSSLFARFLGKYSVGYATNLRKKNFDLRVNYFHSDYEVESFLNMYEKICEKFNISCDRSWAIPFIKLNNLKKNNKLVCIFTGASIDYRKWNIQKYAKLIKKLINEGFRISLIGGKEDIEFNEKISALIDIDIENYTGKTTLSETAKIISQSNVLFSTDSGILHLAVALGIKTVSMFGSGIQEKWGPKGEKHIVINKKLDCSPCTRFGNTPKCHKNAECMKNIEIQEVFEAVCKLSILDN